MRRSNKFVMLITAFVFVISFMATNFAFGTTMKTHAATGNYFDHQAVPAKATMGETINLPVPSTQNLIEVTNPLGDKVELSGATFTASMAGYYNVDYYFKDGTFYKGLKIFVKAENPEFVIPFGGAEIPTYIAKGTAVKIPAATLAVYKADGTIDEDATADVNQIFTITYKVMNPTGTEDTLTVGGDGYCTFTPNQAGSYFVRYIAKSANQTISEDFTVKVQNEFEDKDKPELTAPNVPSDVNQKSKVTLPIASATDNFDAKVKIAISVTDKDNKPVKGYNDDDPKDVKPTTTDAIFDNSRNMSFYTFLGETYTVKYTATDDSGNSMEVVYPITVADRQAPTFDLEENIVPSKWGKIVKYGDSDNPTTLADSKIRFPAPYAYDNVTTEANLSYTFTLKSPSGANFYVATVKGGIVTLDPSYKDSSVSASRESGMTKSDYFAFDVNAYGASQTLGEYVATYTVKDEKNNSKTETYRVNITGTYEDYTMPELEIKNIPDFIFVGDEFVPQSISAYDKEDTTTVYLDVVYDYKATGNGTDRNDFFDEDDSITFDDEGVITINVTAKDKVGNTVTEKINIQVIDPTIVKQAPAIAYTVAAENLDGANIVADLDNGGLFSLSSLTVTGALDNYMGCEIVVRAPAKNNAKTTIDGVDYYGTGVIVSSSSEFVRTDNVSSKIEFKSFSFKTTQIGTYSVTIRAFDVAGCSSFTTLLVNVTGSEFPYTPNETLSVNTTVPTTLQLNEAFALPKYTAQEGYQILTAITGPQYELKGNIFTPKANGSYKISFCNYKDGVKSPAKTFDVTVTDTATPTFTLLEEYSSYVKKWIEADYEKLTGAERYAKMAKVPAVSVTSITGVTNLTVSVKDKVNETVKTEMYEGREYFKPVKDGQYVITYTVKTLSNTAYHDIKMFSGDLVQPTWKPGIMVAPAPSYKVDDEFTFSEILAEDETTNDNNITYYKKLIGPDKSELYSDSSSKTTKKFTFTKAGIYKVIYEATDEAGNKAIKEYTISVTGKQDGGINYQLLTTVLIIIVVILIISVGAYMLFFRKQKERA